MTASAAALLPGFADAPLQSQAAFRTIMNALARPARPLPFAGPVTPPQPLPPELGLVALTLADADAPLWLDPSLAKALDVVAWLRFHTGAPMTANPRDAAFALVADPARMPRLAAFAQGTDEYPDRSTTLVLALPGFAGTGPLHFAGPGMDGIVSIAPQGLPDDFAAQWTGNRAQFPRGVDLLMAAPGLIAGLPRSSRLVEGG